MAIRDYRPETTAPGPTRLPMQSIEGAAAAYSGLDALGKGIANVGEVLELARQSREMNDARLRLTEGMGALNRDLADDTDFEGMRDRYGARLKSLSDEVMAGLRTPRLKSAMSLELAQARVAGEARVMAREQDLSGSHARAVVMRTIRSATSQIPVAQSPEEAQAIYESTDRVIDDALAAGDLDEETAERLRAARDTDTASGFALGEINRDPAAAAEKLAVPGAFGLEEVPRQQYLAMAQRQAAAAASQARTVLERRVDAARKLLVEGKVVPPDELSALSEQVIGTDLAGPFLAAVRASEQLGGFSAATPEERAAFIAAEKKKGISVDDVTVGNAWIAALEEVDRKLTAAETAETRAVGERVKAAVTAMGDGREVADLAELREAAEGTPFADDLDRAEERRRIVAAFPAATPAQREALLKDAQASGVLTGSRVEDEAYITALEDADRNARGAVEQDWVQYALDQGIPGAEAIDLSDPQSFTRRVALAAYMQENYGASPRSFLSASERTALKDQLEAGTPEEQLQLVLGVNAGAGPAGDRIFRELGGLKPAIRRAGRLVAEGGDVETAGIILRGMKAQETGGELYAPSDAATTAFDLDLDAAFPDGGGLREEVAAAARAYYAARAAGRVGTDWHRQRDLLREGVQRVLGGQMVGGVLYGGTQEVNGILTRLPPGSTADQVEGLLSGASAEQWRAASLSGGDPMEGDSPVLPSDAVLVWTGEGAIYRVGVPSNRGDVEFYQDPLTDNGYFYIDLSRLGAAQ